MNELLANAKEMAIDSYNSYGDEQTFWFADGSFIIISICNQRATIYSVSAKIAEYHPTDFYFAHDLAS